MSLNGDQSERLAESVRQAAADKRTLSILGSGSKGFLLPDADTDGGRLLSVIEHQGIVDYRPDELVVTVRAGTPLKSVRQVLAREDQMLPFEPPEFRGLGTIGGALAAGLSGCGRPWRGSLRDAVLGVVMINGLGEVLRFGGRVVKNVAGYDVSRLLAGSFGTLGVVLEVSLKVAPRPQAERTQVLEIEADAALEQMRRHCRRPLPITGMCHFDGLLYVRLSGAEPAVRAAAAQVGGEASADGEVWQRVNDQRLPLFREPGGLRLWRTAPAAPLSEGWSGLIDWAGARRWLRSEDADSVGCAFDASYARESCLAPAGNVLVGEYQQRVRVAFDPHGIFNPELVRADVAA